MGKALMARYQGEDTSLTDKVYNIFWEEQEDHIWVIRESRKEKTVSWNESKDLDRVV